MIDPLEIPVFEKSDIQVSSIVVSHGGRIQLNLGFKHRKDCLSASQFLTNIVSEMISDETEEGE